MGAFCMIWAASSSSWAAWSSPLALMTLARRSRSVSACRAMARFMFSGSTTSRTSTETTLMPHGSVCRSMISWMFLLIFSRSASSSSSSTWPMMLRSVVWASQVVACMYCSTSRTAFSAFITRKKVMASTSTVTLSFVITSWRSTLIVSTRRSTRSILSMKGTSSTSPGPFVSR